jgi:hypothetical protein
MNEAAFHTALSPHGGRAIMRHLLLPIALLATIAASGSPARAQDLGPDSSEYLIKAGFIYNFAKLVEWPASLARKDQPIVIGVLENDQFATILDRVVNGKNLDGRPFIVKRLKSQEFRDCVCHMLFIAGAGNARLQEIIEFQTTASVLTISDAPDFAKRGGMIAFVLEDSKVRFQVNVAAAKRAALTISSRLLSLATRVWTS